ncbi:MAG: 5-methyltetrahydropteroyltriglutamate--homocysteine S-methyltransferase, partial [Gemmatimonadetes bacterium]|nr:5-methyltetrahydropteroyltriglutamate--homocysteine S-methyltransferase [Gemmatimonadota bacterium]
GLEREAAEIRRGNWETQRAAGIDVIPINDFSLYDHVLDAVALLGAVPPRYRWSGEPVDLDTYFAMARGAQREGLDVSALEMTKWFDTNYHYLVPEFWSGMQLRIASEKPFQELAEARALGIEAKPVLLGPLSFVLLGKRKDERVNPLRDVLEPVAELYAEILSRLADLGARTIQLDEPCFVLDRRVEELRAAEQAYETIAHARRGGGSGDGKLIVQTYFGHVGESYSTLVNLPVDGIGFDLVRGPDNLELMEDYGFPPDKILVAGVVDGRNVWINDLERSLNTLGQLAEWVDPDRLWVAPSCSLLHVPIDVEREAHLDPELRSWLAFARQKLDEVATLTRGLDEGRAAIAEHLERNQAALESRRNSTRTRNPEVRGRLEEILRSPGLWARSPYPQRRAIQRPRLGLPECLRTTTIGSYPQTPDVRRKRREFRDGKSSAADYERFLEGEIERVIRLQEEIGLDVLVHGEFERPDMVEYFGEQMEGFAFTEHAWVQSYGSRYVKPPILYGDVRRPQPMTVRWITYAQSSTAKPVKGMLTGPVTILQWSFVRDDQPRADTCRQIALAVRDEVLDLEKAGIRVIQVDEPALREGLPLRRRDWADYLRWAVGCFRLATGGVRDATQVHTHMCYSEFADIFDSIAAMDADVLLIENARSEAELLHVFREFRYPNE